MLWLLPFALAVAGVVVLTVLASRVRREISPTVAVIDRFGREHRVALTTALRRLRDDTAQTRRRLSGD
jgi:cytochrome c-type biogenesis protein CcmH/NrfF